MFTTVHPPAEGSEPGALPWFTRTWVVAGAEVGRLPGLGSSFGKGRSNLTAATLRAATGRAEVSRW